MIIHSLCLTTHLTQLNIFIFVINLEYSSA